MLKKKNRLNKKEFDSIFKNGKKSFSENFMFIDGGESETMDIKISTTVSKKIYKTAVERNKSRRIVYKVLKENFEKIPEKKKAIFIAIKPILLVDRKKIEGEILSFLKHK